jgi:hypothetical protein
MARIAFTLPAMSCRSLLAVGVVPVTEPGPCGDVVLPPPLLPPHPANNTAAHNAAAVMLLTIQRLFNSASFGFACSRDPISCSSGIPAP